jgi:hypothetical protein
MHCDHPEIRIIVAMDFSQLKSMRFADNITERFVALHQFLLCIVDTCFCEKLNFSVILQTYAFYSTTAVNCSHIALSIQRVCSKDYGLKGNVGILYGWLLFLYALSHGVASGLLKRTLQSCGTAPRVVSKKSI